MKTITFQTGVLTKTSVLIGLHIQKEILNYLQKVSPSKIVYITEKNLIDNLRSYLPANNNQILTLNNGEQEKNIENLKNIFEFLLTNHIDKRSLIVGFGGGKISDIVGLASSLFYRGVPVVFIPTTFLSQIDASIGGKNTINFAGVKNVIGTIYQPQAVFIDTCHLRNLPKRQFNSGMAEMIKYGLGFNEKIFNLLMKDKIKTNDLIDLIEKAIRIKVNIIAKDPNEKGLRKLLNLGHTLGHAVESIYSGKLSHGEAIAIGLHFSSFVAKQLGKITQDDLEKIVVLLCNYRLPVSATLDVKQIIERITFDKKKAADIIDFITIENIGHAFIQKIKIDKLADYLYKFKTVTTTERLPAFGGAAQ